jgi:hypothetical protein
VQELRARMGVFLVVAAVLFTALAARLVYLNGAVYRLTDASGLEIEVFTQYPAPGDEAPLPASDSVAPASARVPDLQGSSFEQAGEALLARGLYTAAFGDLSGIVVRQEPPAGTSVERGDMVKVWLEVR